MTVIELITVILQHKKATLAIFVLALIVGKIFYTYEETKENIRFMECTSS